LGVDISAELAMETTGAMKLAPTNLYQTSTVAVTE
jgi:hypothetical protein